MSGTSFGLDTHAAAPDRSSWTSNDQSGAAAAWEAAMQESGVGHAIAGSGPVPTRRRLEQTPSENAEQFQSDPLAFSAQHFIQTGNQASGSNFIPGAGATSPAPGAPITGATSVVHYSLPGATGGGNPVSLQLGATGQPAYWLPYTGGQSTSISVPAHPGPGQPTVLFTGGLTGCSFYGTPAADGTVTFTHTAQLANSDSATGVTGSVAIPPGSVGASYDPAVAPNVSYGPQNYPQGSAANPGHADSSLNPTGSASAYAYYNQQDGQWHILMQGAVVANSHGSVIGTADDPPGQQSVGQGGGLGGVSVQDIAVPAHQVPAGGQAGTASDPGPSHGGSLGSAIGNGSLVGAGTGAAIGSVVGPEGTVIGGLAGLIAGAEIGFITGAIQSLHRPNG